MKLLQYNIYLCVVFIILPATYCNILVCVIILYNIMISSIYNFIAIYCKAVEELTVISPSAISIPTSVTL